MGKKSYIYSRNPQIFDKELDDMIMSGVEELCVGWLKKNLSERIKRGKLIAKQKRAAAK